MKKIMFNKKTAILAAGVTLPLAAAAILLPKWRRGRGKKTTRGCRL